MTHGLTVRKPMVAAINGGCAGIGLVQALVCDVRFASSGAKLATSFARRGLPAEFASSWLLTRLIGTGRAMDLLLSARTITAEEAVALGLVNWMRPPDELLPAAVAYARDLALNCSPSSMAAIKAQVAADWHRTHDESLLDAVARVADPGGPPRLRRGRLLLRRAPPAPVPVPAAPHRLRPCRRRMGRRARSELLLPRGRNSSSPRSELLRSRGRSGARAGPVGSPLWPTHPW